MNVVLFEDDGQGLFQDPAPRASHDVTDDQDVHVRVRSLRVSLGDAQYASLSGPSLNWLNFFPIPVLLLFWQLHSCCHGLFLTMPRKFSLIEVSHIQSFLLKI